MEQGWNWTLGKQVRHLILTHNNIFISDSSGVDSGIKHWMNHKSVCARGVGNEHILGGC